MMSKEIDKRVIYGSDLRGSPEPSDRKFLYGAVGIGNLIVLAVGISIGWTSPVLPKLQSSNNPFGRPITKEEESWIGSLLAIGGILGPFAAGYSADKIGRKKTLVFLCGIPSLCSYLLLAFGQVIVLYFIGRFLAGFTAGAVYTVLPNFHSEIAENHNRGAISSSINAFAMFGTLFAYAVGPYVSIMWFSIVCAIFPAVFIATFPIFVPETPYYLQANNDYLGALSSLSRYRAANESEVKVELEYIRTVIEKSSQIKTSYMDIFKSRSLIKALFISLALIAFQQFSGITIVLFYTQNIFEATKSSIPSDISPIIIGSVQVATSFTTPFLIDKMGRKFLLLISAIGMVISEVPLGLYFYLSDNGHDVFAIYWLPIVCLVSYVITFTFGFGGIPWTIMGELFPPNVKGMASTATVSFCWIIGFFISKYFNNVSDVIGMAGSFWIFSGSCCVAIVFVATYLIETKGKSLMQIQEILEK